MVRGLNGRLVCLAGAALFALVVALPAAAQSTGLLKGVVKDASGQPVDGAKINIDMSEGVNRHFETKSNKKGEFVQIGLPPGRYNIIAEKDKMSSPPSTAAVSVGRQADVVIVIGAAAAGRASKEADAKNAELKKAFEEGIAASQANNYDGAIAAFSRAAEINPSCSDCQYNMGSMYAQKKDYEKAEAAYKKAIELRPEYAEAYNGLATIYNAQRKFDLAAEASKKGMEIGGGGRRGRGGRRKRRRDVQPGRDSLERGEDCRRQEAVRSGDRGQSESCRSALPARHVARERRQSERRGGRVRHVPEARAQRSKRRDREGHSLDDQEVSESRRGPRTSCRRPRAHRASRPPRGS